MNNSNSHRALKQISFYFGFIGLMVGFLAGYGVLSGDSLGRVNLISVLILFAFLPVIFLIISFIFIVRGGGRGLAGWILELPNLPPRLAVEILHLDLSGSRKSWLVYQTQVLALSFAFGGLLVYLWLLIGSDISFVWRSTLLEAADLLPVLHVLALPWWFWTEAQPGLDLLQQTQDFRLGVQTADAPVLGRWWKYVFAAQCTYNLLPRTLMLLIAKRCYEHHVSAYSISQGQDQPGRDALNRLADEAVLAPVVDAITTPYILLDWAKSPDFCRTHISNIIGAPVEVRGIEPLPLATAADNAVATQSLLVLVKSWEPPLGELGDYLHSLSGLQQKFILPLDWGEGAVKPITANHLNEWRRFCGTLSGWQLLQLDETP